MTTRGRCSASTPSATGVTRCRRLPPRRPRAIPTNANLERRRLGSSELEVSEVGLGGNTFGAPRLDAKATDRVIHAALDLGVNFVDTAIIYGGGDSERYLGQALGARRDEMVIATKCHLMKLGDESVTARINRQIDESLSKLGTDRVELYQLHFPAGDVRADEIMGALDALVQSGKARAIGVCNYASWRLAESALAAQASNGTPVATVQDYYHVLARQVESEVIPACEHLGISLLPYHPLAGGFLTGKYRKGQPHPPGTRGAAGSPIVTAISTEENWQRLAQLQAFAQARGRRIGELAIAWLLSNPVVGSVIAGVSNVEQLQANVGAASWKLPPEEKSEVEMLATGAPVPSPERAPYR